MAVRRRARNVSLLFVIWVVIGVVVAIERHYLTETVLKYVVSALLAILLWPLVLLGVNLQLV